MDPTKAPLEIVQGLEIKDEVVRLDGRHFIDCSFTNCTLEYGGANLILERTAMVNCRYALDGCAFQTLQFLKVLGLAPDIGLTLASPCSAIVH